MSGGLQEAFDAWQREWNESTDGSEEKWSAFCAGIELGRKLERLDIAKWLIKKDPYYTGDLLEVRPLAAKILHGEHER